MRAELTALRVAAASAYVGDHEKDEKYSLVTFDARVIESILGDTYSITASDHQLLGALTRIRQITTTMNNKIRLFFSVVAMPDDRQETARPGSQRLHGTTMR